MVTLKVADVINERPLIENTYYIILVHSFLSSKSKTKAPVGSNTYIRDNTVGVLKLSKRGIESASENMQIFTLEYWKIIKRKYLFRLYFLKNRLRDLYLLTGYDSQD